MVKQLAKDYGPPLAQSIAGAIIAFVVFVGYQTIVAKEAGLTFTDERRIKTELQANFGQRMDRLDSRLADRLKELDGRLEKVQDVQTQILLELRKFN